MIAKPKPLMLSPRVKQRSESTRRIQLPDSPSSQPCSDVDEGSSVNKCYRDFTSDHSIKIDELSDSLESIDSCDADADEFESGFVLPRKLDKPVDEQSRFQRKLNEIMLKFGFLNPEVVIEEEDPSKIQLTTQMSTHQETAGKIILKKHRGRNTGIKKQVETHKTVLQSCNLLRSRASNDPVKPAVPVRSAKKEPVKKTRSVSTRNGLESTPCKTQQKVQRFIS